MNDGPGLVPSFPIAITVMLALVPITFFAKWALVTLYLTFE